MNAASDVTARFLHAVKEKKERRPCVSGSRAGYLHLESCSTTRKGETDNKKLLPNRGKKKQNRNSGWSYCINGLAKKKTLSLVLSVIDAVDVFLDDPFPIFLR